MASRNLFDLLDDDTEDPSAVIAAAQAKLAASPAAPVAAAAKKPAAANNSTTKPAKPLPRTQPLREARNGVRGRERGDNQKVGFSPGQRAPQQESSFGYDEVEKQSTERLGSERYGDEYRGGWRNGSNNEDGAEERPPRRVYERRSGTGRGSAFKRDGAGRGNWGSTNDEIAQEFVGPVSETEADADAEKPSAEGEENADKEISVKEPEEKEPEQMTLQEYEKVLEEKRKVLLSLKGEETKGLERKVDVEKEFQSMQLVSKKKNDDEVFIKLDSDKDRRKDAADKEEKAKKSVSINEFLKPAGGESYNRRGGGRGRGNRSREGYGGSYAMNYAAPAIEDVKQFPVLGAR